MGFLFKKSSFRKKKKEPVKHKVRRKTKKHYQQKNIESFIEEIKKSIVKNGKATLSVSSILKEFGVRRRTLKNIEYINNELYKNGIFCNPKLSVRLKITDKIKLKDHFDVSSEIIFKTERELEDFILEKHLYKKLDIESVERQYSPIGTSDRFDFKGIGINGENVILELKNRGGGKSAIEQVFRYKDDLLKESPEKEIRLILVTGVKNDETIRAIRGMKKDRKGVFDDFEWYIYKYSKDGEFAFERIAIEEL